jgi:hypothetical protein
VAETPHPLADAEVRVERAKEHIDDLVRLVNEFAGEQAEKLDVGQSPETGGLEVRPPEDRPPISPKAKVLVGEAVYNLRAALDYLVYILACTNRQRHVPGTQFPIEDKPEMFEGRITGRVGNRQVARYLKDVPSDAVDLIRELQPFRGVEWTKMLRELSNPDKHRQLTTFLTRGEASAEVVHADDAQFEYRSRLIVTLLLPDGGNLIETLYRLQAEVGATVQLFKRGFQRVESSGD